MPLDAPVYPVNLIVAGRRVLVVGGGTVAAAKIRGLLAAGAEVHVIAPEVSDEVRALPVELDERAYERGDVAGHRLVVAATDSPEVNRAVFDDAEAAGIWVNAADDPAHCSMTLPARLQRGPLLVTVSTSGRSPAFAAWLRDELAGWLGPEHDALLDLLAEAREALANAGRSRSPSDWRDAMDSGMLDLIRSGRIAAARGRLHAALGLDEPSQPERH